MSELTKVKRIVDFLVFVVYSLKWETCLFQDQYAMNPAIDIGTTTDLEGTEYDIIKRFYQNIVLS